ncbi:HEAT repeat domain-containing protein [Streptomyces sp. NPDC046862]|uniref:HEAT repeat domain-containing protein n=1 Tax=Streptomyces sp. NPDC046862 TaxID=3154603 RepID=UPI0034527D8B
MAAVRAGDAEAVRALLDKGADPDVSDANGVSALCVAVAAYDASVAEALVEGGANPDQVLPDGTTPLRRAIDGGSPAVFSAALGKEPRLRLPESARERLLALARSWYETGAAEELRRRTGASGSAVTVRVQDDENDWVDQVSLGGLAVRAGHGAILTSLEWAFRVLTPVDELIARAVGRPDERHVNWSAVLWTLVERRSFETWSAVVAHRHHSAPAHRRFVADYVRTRALVHWGSSYYAKKESELLAAWAAEETDSEILAKVLDSFTTYVDTGKESIGLRHAHHPDPRVRREVPYTLAWEGVCRSAEARSALRGLMRDPDAEVRLRACAAGTGDDDLLPDIIQALLLLAEAPDPEVRREAVRVLAGSRDRTPAVADALAALLGEDDRLVRLEAAYGLAVREDPRTEEAIERVGPLGAGFDHDHRVSALWRWRRRSEDPSAGSNAVER